MGEEGGRGAVKFRYQFPQLQRRRPNFFKSALHGKSCRCLFLSLSPSLSSGEANFIYVSEREGGREGGRALSGVESAVVARRRDCLIQPGRHGTRPGWACGRRPFTFMRQRRAREVAFESLRAKRRLRERWWCAPLFAHDRFCAESQLFPHNNAATSLEET